MSDTTAPPVVAERKPRKYSTTVYIRQEQDRALRELHARTKVPAAEYIRRGIDLVLALEEANGNVSRAA